MKIAPVSGIFIVILAGCGGEDPSAAAEVPACTLAGMEVDDDGNLWVLRGDTDDIRFDVWNISGDRVLECLLPGLEPGDLRFRIRGDRMLLYRENPMDYQKIYIVGIPDQSRDERSSSMNGAMNRAGR